MSDYATTSALVGVALTLWSKDDGEKVPFPGSVTVVEHQRSEVTRDERTELGLIVEVSGQLYRIEGQMDSYGDFEFWSAAPVTAKTKTVTVYE